MAVLFCLTFCFILSATSAYADDGKTNVDYMNDMAYNTVYKGVMSVLCPLAIISLASCGFKFISSIFFGDYASMAGNSMMKAQKQFWYTVIIMIVAIAMPSIYGYAIELFKSSAWKPA